MRLQTENGLTNPLVFCVGQLPEMVEKSGREVAVEESQKRGGRGRKRQATSRPDPGTSPTSNEPEIETDITLPATLNGQILPGDVDRYRFEARQGQHLVVDVSARKLIPYLSDAVPGWFQATVALLDAEGREVVFDDDFRFHPDPVLHCEIPEDGTYVVEIRDALYRGREDFVYRVAVGELPYVTDVFPLGSQAGEETTFSLNGWNLAQTEFTRTIPEPGMHLVSSGKDGVASNPVPISVDTMPEHLETEPNNSLDDAQQVSLPTIVNGRIDRAGDIDVFCIDCRAGTEIVAEVYARRLGSSLDSVIKLTDANGKQVAMNDDYEDKTAGLTTHHADSRLSARIQRSGHYYLYLGDGQQQGGDAYSYRLHLGPLRPDFELARCAVERQRPSRHDRANYGSRHAKGRLRRRDRVGAERVASRLRPQRRPHSRRLRHRPSDIDRPVRSNQPNFALAGRSGDDPATYRHASGWPGRRHDAGLHLSASRSGRRPPGCCYRSCSRIKRHGRARNAAREDSC